MVTDAVKGHSALTSAKSYVYTKGSYANNTNVRRDSDVDIVVECQSHSAYDYMPGQDPPTAKAATPDNSEWSSPARFRHEVIAALTASFGASSIDTTGKVAIAIAPVPGSRPSIDVVPSYDYFLYNDSQKNSWRRGSCVFPTSGNRIVNWPDQQLENGRAKNQRTGSRYKNFVRALKNAENALVKAGTINEKPSYLMECLVWNVKDATLKSGNLSDGFRGTLFELWQGLDKNNTDDWTEPNDIKYLFKGDKKWTVDDAKSVVLETYRYLEYT
jgi:hypothetical protein